MTIFRYWTSRIKNAFTQLPARLLRLGMHFYQLANLIMARDFNQLAFWPIDLGFLLMDILGVPEWYELISNLFKTKLRPLSEKEIRIATKVFGTSIDYSMVRLDEAAWLGPKQGGFAYVGFNTINSYGQMSNTILIHELMHIWQFQHLGSVYIGRALWAQHSKEKYDYGGLERLRDVVRKEGSILTFNYEQQGDIVADYYLLVNGHRPQWSDASYADFHLYEYFIHEIRMKEALIA